MLFNNQPPKPRLSADDFEVRIWGFVVVAVTLILFVIVMSLLYSVTFVTQPIKSMAPIDQAYTKMLNDIVLLIVGGIGGVMSKRAVSAAAKAMAPTPQPPAGCPPMTGATTAYFQPQAGMTSGGIAPASAMPNWNWMGYQNPELDETWTPPPPPSTPPNHIPPEAEEIAHERAAARSEA
jgi:hypothetical protein